MSRMKTSNVGGCVAVQAAPRGHRHSKAPSAHAAAARWRAGSCSAASGRPAKPRQKVQWQRRHDFGQQQGAARGSRRPVQGGGAAAAAASGARPGRVCSAAKGAAQPRCHPKRNQCARRCAAAGSEFCQGRYAGPLHWPQVACSFYGQRQLLADHCWEPAGCRFSLSLAIGV